VGYIFWVKIMGGWPFSAKFINPAQGRVFENDLGAGRGM